VLAQVQSLRGVGVAHVAAGSAHTAVASSIGQLWVCGKSSGGQLGLGQVVMERMLISRFTPVLSLHPAHRVVQVACGDAHTCVLTAERRLFSFGVGKHGQLGHPTAKPKVSVPRAVDGLPAACFISCGGQHTVALGADRQLYTWGSGKGCLGQGPGVTRMPVPTQICAND
jgi:alpha-tubulin suppressor-like RCC1 family protein